MYPVLATFSLAGTVVSLGAYTTFLVLAALIGGLAAGRVLVADGLSRRWAAIGLTGAILVGLAGARLVAVLLNPATYLADPGAILAPAPRGFALYGGLAGSGLVLIWLARRAKLDLARLADRLIGPIAVGLILLRIGCFLNGCCSGLPTNLPWGVTFPGGGVSWGQQLLGGSTAALFGAVSPVHPTQLYEALAVLILAGIVFWLRRRALPPGAAALFFTAGFLAFRAFNQTLRVPSLEGALPTGVLVGAYALGALLAAVALGRLLIGSPEQTRLPAISRAS